MDSLTKAKEWINQNIPMLAVVYQNRYVGMLYDKFASLPGKQQKQVVLGSTLGALGIVFLLLLSFYLSFWSQVSKSQKGQEMIGLLIQYQKTRRAQESQMEILERNNRLAPPDALKQHLVAQARTANISPRLIKAEEKPDTGGGDDPKSSEVRAKQATVKLERVNLNQLRTYLQAVEVGPYNLAVSSLQIANDDKIRGYMNVELGVIAYLFQGAEESTP